MGRARCALEGGEGQPLVYVNQRKHTRCGKRAGKGICSFVTVTAWEIHRKKAQKVQGPKVNLGLLLTADVLFCALHVA